MGLCPLLVTQQLVKQTVRIPRATLKAGMTERWNEGMAESRNGGKYPQILKDGIAENQPKS